MTNDEQRIAIAEVMGWKDIKDGTNRLTMPNGERQFFHTFEKSWEDFVPDYPNDLNAMHEAENLLDSASVDKRSKWLDFLALSCDWPKTENAADLRFEVQYLTARATAPQRAEAFLRTLGKWKE